MIANRFRRIDSSTTPKTGARTHGGPGSIGVEFDEGTDSLVLIRDNPGTEAQSIALPATFSISTLIASTDAATADNYGGFFIAPYPVEVVSVRERHETAGSDGSAVTLNVQKVPSGTAKGSGTDLLSAGINLKGTADTNASGTLTTTTADLRLATGDALALVPTGTLTAVNGVTVTVELKRRATF